MDRTASRLESLALSSRGGSRDREEISRRAPPSPVPDGQRKGDAKPPKCLGCGGSISGSYLVAPGNRRGAYHAQCLRCEACAEPTERFVIVDEGPHVEGSVGRIKNKNVPRDLLVCARCHDERFAEKCGKCRLPLRGTILNALGSKFHAECFRCSLCDASLASGTFVQMPNDEKKAACASCHERELAAKCGGCGRGVVGDHVVALRGTPFHKACFCCTKCRVSLVGAKHVPHEGKAWCAECHVAAFAERCGCGCGRGVTGDVVVALGKRFLAGHFNCAECRGPFPDGDFMKVDLETRNEGRPEDVALSPNRSAPASRRTSTSSANDADWTKPKPKPSSRAFVAAAVCRACYASNHAERCACCAVPLVGCRFVRVDAWDERANTNSEGGNKGEAMCLKCESEPGNLCDDCGRCVSRVDRVRSLEKTARRESGGLATIGQCGSCRSTAVRSDEAAKAIFEDVAETLESVGARDAPPAASRDVVVRLVEADYLASAANKRHRGPSAEGPRGVTRTKVELRGTAPKERWTEIVDGWRLDRETNEEGRPASAIFLSDDVERSAPRRSPATTRRVAETALARPDVSVRERRFIKDVLLLRGMSRTATGATLAHEYGHCYLFARAFPSLPLKVEEGVCELFAWLWLGGGLSVPAATRATVNGADEAQNARRRARMEKRQDPVYGEGFRDAKKALERCGGNLWTLLEYVRANAALPT
jgi:paxillin